MSIENKKWSLGIVGARGYVGQELITLLKGHPSMDIAWISLRDTSDLPESLLSCLPKAVEISSLTPEQIAAKGTDIVVLALPNGVAVSYVEAIEEGSNTKVIIDLSADYRFDNGWVYSLPELHPDAISSQKNAPLIKISNPGCYATAMQLAIAPVKSLLSARPNCFGVSGYSGAGSKPSPNNDPENLRDNLIGYTLIEHLHEKEVSYHLNQPISFSPHVASFFRGINMTVHLEFKEPTDAASLLAIYQEAYKNDPLVQVQKEVPTVRKVVNTPICLIGGFSVSQDGKRATVVSCIDNLLKGAASQALQNIHLAIGVTHTQGLA